MVRPKELSDRRREAVRGAVRGASGAVVSGSAQGGCSRCGASRPAVQSLPARSAPGVPLLRFRPDYLLMRGEAAENGSNTCAPAACVGDPGGVPGLAQPWFWSCLGSASAGWPAKLRGSSYWLRGAHAAGPLAEGRVLRLCLQTLSIWSSQC
ncbi:uncharacterized protein C1orf53 homolog isoform X1 [Oryctolagus cuniculus]|uniref:uncharacterized protein C1orf53 homolog isoform X1 n=1 Tax=Oryctolagus cuniculus TaxID=9986 RepID=UPI00387A27A9